MDDEWLGLGFFEDSVILIIHLIWKDGFVLLNFSISFDVKEHNSPYQCTYFLISADDLD